MDDDALHRMRHPNVIQIMCTTRTKYIHLSVFVPSKHKHSINGTYIQRSIHSSSCESVAQNIYSTDRVFVCRHLVTCVFSFFIEFEFEFRLKMTCQACKEGKVNYINTPIFLCFPLNNRTPVSQKQSNVGERLFYNESANSFIRGEYHTHFDHIQANDANDRNSIRVNRFTRSSWLSICSFMSAKN